MSNINQSNAVAQSSTGNPALDPQRLARALERHRAEFEAIPPEQLLQITVDVAAAAMLVLKRWPSWQPLMARMSGLPEVDFKSIEGLESVAEATLQANADYLTSVAPPTVLSGLLEEADALRDGLREDAEVLMRRGLLPSGSLNEVRGLTGYRNTAVELSALVSMLDKAWSSIQGKTAITREELDRASVVAQQIFRNASERDERQPRQLELTRLRQQAFTALSRSYEQLRRCVGFLYPRPGELDQIAPSFYHGRGGRPVAPENTVPGLPELVNAAQENAASTTAPSAHSGTAVATAGSGAAPERANPNALPSRNPFSS